MHLLLTLAAVFATLLCATAAHAGCEKDTDCKGARVCVAGECREPVAPAPAALPALPTRHSPREVDPGWSKGAGITGLVLAPIVLGLFSGAAATLPKKGGSAIPAAPLGGVGMIVHIVAGGIVGGGAGSARGVRHNVGLLVSGWVLYGVSILYTALEFAIGYGVSNGAPPAEVVGVGGGLSALSIALLSVDALVVASRADARAQSATPASHETRLSLQPVLAPVRHGTQTVGLSGGLRLAF